MSLDTHYSHHIFYPSWWINHQGHHPDHFTTITLQDIKNNIWQPTNPNDKEYAVFYLTQLEKTKKYQLTIWPPHCILHTVGHEIHTELSLALQKWSTKNHRNVLTILKGKEEKTEHYSILKAEVPLKKIPETQLNQSLIDYLDTFDTIEISGEALTHCVGNTIMDLLHHLPTSSRSKVVLLQDCSSPVLGFEKESEEILQNILNLGGHIKKALPLSLKLKK